MPSIEEIQQIFEKFQKNFETVTLTLIGQMNKISENLGRISETMELTDKINIQNVENKQLLNQMDKQMKSLLGRLERMSKGGFVLPELPPEPTVEDMDALLNASYTGPAAATMEENPINPDLNPSSLPQIEENNINSPDLQIDTTSISEEDLDNIDPSTLAELNDLNPEKPLNSLINSADKNLTPVSSIPEEVIPEPGISQNNALNQNIDNQEPPKTDINSINTNKISSTQNGLPSLTSLPPLPSKPIVLQQNPEIATNSQSIEPPPWDAPLTPSISGWDRVQNPISPKDILQNLMLDIESAATVEEVGNLVIHSKDSLAKIVPFNGSYFEMVMYSGPKRAQKGIANNSELINEAFQKIKGWMAKF